MRPRLPTWLLLGTGALLGQIALVLISASHRPARAPTIQLPLQLPAPAVRIERAPTAVPRARQAPAPVALPLLSQNAVSAALMERGAVYRVRLTREAQAVFGLDAPVARLAAQLHQESGWQPDVGSKAGARGLAQFMPATAAAMARLFPDLAPADPLDPTWSMRAQVRLMADLATRWDAVDECERAAFRLSAYNGGEKRLLLERKASADGGRWFNATEVQRKRGLDAWNENRSYVRRILLELEPLYVREGWSDLVTCRGVS